jgi:hypothetical protein
MKRRREIIVPVSVSPQEVRPIRVETHATLAAATARGRRWLDEIVAGTVTTVEQIAAQEKMQHSASPHDDLARVPRARTGEAAIERTAAAWRRRHSSARCPCRVGSPIRDAWSAA